MKNKKVCFRLFRLKNIEDKTDNQLRATEGQNNQLSIKSIEYSVRDELPKEAIKAFDDLVKNDKTINYQKLDNDFGRREYDFTMFSNLEKLLKRLYYGNTLIPDKNRKQDKLYDKIKKLKEYNPITINTINKKDSFLEDIPNFYNGREMLINAFKSRIIPLEDRSYSQYFEEKESDWIKNPEEFIKLENELIKPDHKFSASFNLNEGGTKNINITEIKRFVNDTKSDKINNNKLFIYYKKNV